MAQLEVYSWTNETPAAARNQSVGFKVDEVQITTKDGGDVYYWNSAMDADTAVNVSTGLGISSNGITLLEENTRIGAYISGFTNASPGVITVDDTTIFGFAVGDTIKVTALADDQTGDTLNGEYEIASLTDTTITTTTDTTTFSAWVSGGYVTRVTNADGEAIAVVNRAIEGITIGTGVVGGDGDDMVMVVRGGNHVT